ncbi:transmembrane protein 70 homolog, mitochondrial isoform X2 [Ischnura elegans]|uniref:transmembrane protein 70 homolog, mitochondrial isoform X2 n=1 Tax=Ischnura elegans TaxID=197161 RepID=UPI001ED87312|nr:transmembrane protein 70 homolog, mitochondrial isoform X2 [Ischnura elegans]
MLKVLRNLKPGGVFSPAIGHWFLLRDSCILRTAAPSATYWGFSCKGSVEVSQRKNLWHRFSVSYSSAGGGKDTLVYYGNLTPQIRMVKIFSLCSSLTGLAAQPILYNHASELGGTGVLIGVATFVGFFTFVTPVLLHSITKKYVTDLHYNAETGVYTASLLTFFLRVKKVNFKAEEVVVPDVPGMFTSFKVKGCPLFVDPRMFDDPNHYGKLMGYDKPIDFLLKKDAATDKREDLAEKLVKDKNKML